MARVPQRHLREEYRRRFWRVVRARPDPNVLFIFMVKCAAHYHHYMMAHRMADRDAPVVNPF
jgi:hypothetical protein